MTRVGYGSPPTSSRWKKGQSGNPSGRPKGQRNLDTLVGAELARKVRTADGKMLTMAQVIAKRLVAEVAKGQLKWLPLLVRFMDANGQGAAEPELGRVDARLFEQFKAEILREEEGS